MCSKELRICSKGLCVTLKQTNTQESPHKPLVCGVWRLSQGSCESQGFYPTCTEERVQAKRRTTSATGYIFLGKEQPLCRSLSRCVRAALRSWARDPGPLQTLVAGRYNTRGSTRFYVCQAVPEALPFTNLILFFVSWISSQYLCLRLTSFCGENFSLFCSRSDIFFITFWSILWENWSIFQDMLFWQKGKKPFFLS